MSASIQPDDDQPISNTNFKEYFQGLSKEIKSNALAVKTDQKIQKVVEDVFKGLATLKENSAAQAKVTIKGTPITLNSLEFSDIKAFVNFANKFFGSFKANPSDIDTIAPHIPAAAEYVGSRYQSGNLFKMMKVMNVATDVMDLKSKVVVHHPIEDTTRTATVEEKQFIEDKTEELNYRFKYEQVGAKRTLKIHEIFKKIATPLKVASGILVGVGIGLLFTNPVGLAVGLLFVTFVAPFLFFATSSAQDFFKEALAMDTQTLETLQKQKKNLPEFFRFLKDFNINPTALIHQIPRSVNHAEWIAKKKDLNDIEQASHKKAMFDDLMTHFLQYKELKEKIQKLETKKMLLDAQIKGEEAKRNEAPAPTPGSVTIESEKSSLDHLKEQQKKCAEEAKKLDDDLNVLNEQIHLYRAANSDLQQARPQI